MSSLPALKIESPGASWQGTKVFLDGVEIKGLRELTLDISVDDINTVRMVIAVDRVEVDAETLVALQAHVKSKEGDEK